MLGTIAAKTEVCAAGNFDSFPVEQGVAVIEVITKRCGEEYGLLTQRPDNVQVERWREAEIIADKASRHRLRRAEPKRIIFIGVSRRHTDFSPRNRRGLSER